jgi:glycerophosphoryl diester phosphodiesterase
MTRDGVLVVLHDESLDRTARGPTADCTGAIATKTLEQVKRCDMGSWFNETYPAQAKPEYVGQQIPTLEEVFQRYGNGVNYYIETKTLGSLQPMESALLGLIKRYDLFEGSINRRQVLVQSFAIDSLLRMHALDSRIPLVLLMSAGADKLQLQAASGYAFGVGPPVASVTEDTVKNAHALGLAIHPYTVNSEADLERIAALCVDGLFTNLPDRYREVLDSRDLGCPLPIR